MTLATPIQQEFAPAGHRPTASHHRAPVNDSPRLFEAADTLERGFFLDSPF
jgi:hypothetical protein